MARVDAMLARWLSSSSSIRSDKHVDCTSHHKPSKNATDTRIQLADVNALQLQRWTAQLNQRASAQRSNAIQQVQCVMKVDELQNEAEADANAHFRKFIISTLAKALLRHVAHDSEQQRIQIFDVMEQALRTVYDEADVDVEDKNGENTCRYSQLLVYLLPVISLRLSNEADPIFENDQEETTQAEVRPSDAPKQQVTVKPRESSEAVRASMYSCIDAIIQHYKQGNNDGDELTAYVPPLIGALYVGVHDTAPDNRCYAMRTLQHMPLEYVRSSAEMLIEALMKSCVHKLTRVRLEAVRVLRILIPCHSESIRSLSAFREYNIIDVNAFYHGEGQVNFMARLVDDANVKVREAFNEAVCDWIVNMYERADYETLIMPYVLSGFFDTTVTANRSYQTWIKLGEEYEKDFAETLKDELFYGREAEQFLEEKLQSEFAGMNIRSLKPILFPPFLARPGVGMRHLGRKFADRLMNAIANEISDWKLTTQRKSLLLLQVLLQLIEKFVTVHILKLLDPLIAICGNAELDDDVAKCLRLVGRHCEPSALFALIMQHYDNFGYELTNAVSYLLEGADPLTLPTHLDGLLTALANSLLSQNSVRNILAKTKLLSTFLSLELPLPVISQNSCSLFRIVIMLEAQGQVLDAQSISLLKHDLDIALSVLAKASDMSLDNFLQFQADRMFVACGSPMFMSSLSIHSLQWFQIHILIERQLHRSSDGCAFLRTLLASRHTDDEIALAVDRALS